MFAVSFGAFPVGIDFRGFAEAQLTMLGVDGSEASEARSSRCRQ